MRERDTARLRQAADSAQRALVRLAALTDMLPPTSAGISLFAMAEQLYEQRRLRDRYFPGELFGEPAWDLLLALFVALEDGRELSLADAWRAAGVGPAAGRTLVATLEEAGLVAPIPGENGGRPRGLRLTETGVERLCAYLTSII